jgi:hypothetical protein
MLRLNGRQNGSTHNLSLSQQEGTFGPGNSWWICAGPRIRCNRILDDDLLPPTSYLHASRWKAQNEEQHSDPSPDVIDKAILKAFNQTPFASMRELAKSMCISRATVWRCLTGSLGFVVKHLHWPRYLPDRCAMTNSNRLVKRIAQTLRVCTGQWLAKFYDFEWVLVLFVDKPRKSLSSSGSAIPWKSETHDLTVDTLRAVFANWVERPKWVALNEGHYYR